MSKQTVTIVTMLLLVFIGTITILSISLNIGELCVKESGTEIKLSFDKKTKSIFLKTKPSLNLKSNQLMLREEVEQVDSKTNYKVGNRELETLEYEVDTYINKYVNVSSLNVRKGPSVDYEVTGIVVQNQKVEAEKGNGQNGWLQVKTGDFIGFVNGKYLDAKRAKTLENKEQKVAVIKNKQKEGSDIEELTEEKASNDNNSEVKNETKFEKPKEEKKPQSDADKLQTVDSNNQLILVTANGFNTSSAKIQTFERNSDGEWDQVLSVSGHIGKNGFSNNKVEGDGKSPTGKYSIGTAFGRTGNPGTKLSFRQITADDVWVDDPNSSLYNTWQSRKATEGQWDSAENMDINAYTYGFVINYNSSRVPGSGSAIFFHISSGHTLGCTGVSKGNVVSILKWLDPSKNPVIVQTPVSQLGQY
ncbi:hypothetical protein GCM10011351_27690 [Paraliobacillus quinghaiensis]|uniref:SH3b domain-containing protein n=1 Tax=Paraliobacillus quinghaiensis TaxID=470815 RepID=A0A917TVL0_9BACI|nr:SH3 domain-containing protein [Paraliobacillus quinghaiensis]GGM39993.1 hypothetical protein GCM10011351_27690 [Paraliobacillus quinghaiensis]